MLILAAHAVAVTAEKSAAGHEDNWPCWSRERAGSGNTFAAGSSLAVISSKH